MKKKDKIDYIIYGILALSFAWLCFEYTKLPDIIPTHFGYDGQPDGWGTKKTIFLMWFVALAMNPLMKLIKKIDPKSESYDKFIKFFDIFRVVMVCYMLLMGVVVVQSAKGIKIDINRLMMPSLGLLFAFIGNFMPKVKPNYTMGIKTPWTLASESVWYKTHRIAGKMWTVCGIALTLFSLFFSAKIFIPVFFAVLIVMTIYPMFYSYKEFEREKKEKSDET